jgi:multiple sugar transport system substrate-binding protein
MQEPLITGEVWVAWDHIARLANAFNEMPDDFVAFPSPAGPTGRGFMPVIAGLGVPVTAEDADAANRLVAYMMEPETQIATLRATNFYRDTFERILLAGQDVRRVLDQQADALRAVMNNAGAPCWAPDPASDGACPVE